MEVRNVAKMYRVYPAPTARLKEILLLNQRRFHRSEERRVGKECRL